MMWNQICISGASNKKKRKRSGERQVSAAKKQATGAASLSELQQKLQNKLAELRGKNGPQIHCDTETDCVCVFAGT